MDFFGDIVKPTLVLNQQRARSNIARMAEKSHAQGIRFRPHFKTHQSAAIAEWFRAAGTACITVSSVDMAVYFASHGWDDITIAFPVNLRQMDALSALARESHLGLLVESPESAAALQERLDGPADIWIKIDTGSHRTGIPWDQPGAVQAVITPIKCTPNLTLRGLLTHAGHTYAASSPDEIRRIYNETLQRLQTLRDTLGGGLEISVGDTPACSVVQDLSGVDEIRPGNFIFYDAEQYLLGSCTWEEVAVAVACPVAALHPEREEVVVYGGAIHLSKDFMAYQGRPAYGLVALPEGDHWGGALAGAYVRSLSQEHGMVHIPASALKNIQVGDLLFVIPAHSCLTITALGRYRTLSGEIILTMNVES
jgi:D-serine deaminase-like pyridoxal phosphate-dependent protein